MDKIPEQSRIQPPPLHYFISPADILARQKEETHLAEEETVNEDTWIIDSMSTCHIGNKEEYFTDIHPFTGQVKGLGGLAKIEGIGNISLYLPETSKLKHESPLTLKEAYYIPSSPVNLISLSKLTD